MTWMLQVAEAVDYFHQQGVMYTDLKAESVKHFYIVHLFIHRHAGVGIYSSTRKMMRNWATWKASTLKPQTTYIITKTTWNYTDHPSLHGQHKETSGL